MKTVFENIYDAYCPMLYGIALQICPTSAKADKILILTFQKVHIQNLVPQDNKSFCFELIKLMIRTAQEELHPGKTKCNLKIKQFEKTSLLHLLLVEQLTLQDYCIQNRITYNEAIANIKKEFMLIRNSAGKNTIAIEVNSEIQLK